jgi:hypothetical protein
MFPGSAHDFSFHDQMLIANKSRRRLLRTARAFPGRIDLLLTDVVCHAGRNGPEMANNLKPIRSELQG